MKNVQATLKFQCGGTGHTSMSPSHPVTLVINEFRQFPKMTIDPGLSTLLPIKIDSEQSLRASDNGQVYHRSFRA